MSYSLNSVNPQIYSILASISKNQISNFRGFTVNLIVHCCMLGNFLCILLSSDILQKYFFFKFFHKHYQSIKRFHG